MNKSNPIYILRNEIAQNAIEKAESGDFSEVKNLLKLFEKPFEENQEFRHLERPSEVLSVRHVFVFLFFVSAYFLA